MAEEFLVDNRRSRRQISKNNRDNSNNGSNNGNSDKKVISNQNSSSKNYATSINNNKSDNKDHYNCKRKWSRSNSAKKGCSKSRISKQRHRISNINKMNLSLLIGVLASWSVARCEQRFAETPPMYQEVSSGEDVQLRCRVHEKRGQCIWQKDGKLPGMHPDKYEWATGRGNDCTLLIRRASLDLDDGLWTCQVTHGDVNRQDALTSLPSRLLVRVKPRKPRLEYGGTILNTGLTLREGQEVTISCVSRYGNPPALIKWYIGGDEMEPVREQTNATELDSPRTWMAQSLLRVKAHRENHGLPVRCITTHPSSIVPATAETRLDVHYSPEVKLETSPRIVAASLEDSSSFLSLRCYADANPAATLKWFKDSSPVTSRNILPLTLNRTLQNGTVSGSEIRFEPVHTADAGLYTCKAVNIIGESAPANYRLDVQYGPRPIKDASPSNETTEIEETTQLGSSLEPFECPEFDGNPPAQYRWVHLRGGTREMIDNPLDRSDKGRKLRLENVMWSDEGEYRCVAFNLINGVRREASSEARYVLHVTGPPEIQARPSSGVDGFYESVGWAGEPVHRLKSRFCSRPPPRLVAWEWGSSHIRAGEKIQPKYEALPLEPIIENKMVTNCYWAKLEIHDLSKDDARVYQLLVESEKGRDSTSIRLLVRDAIEIRVIAAAAAVGLVFFLFLVSLGSYSVLKLRSRRYRRENGEEDGSIAADAFYNNASPARKTQQKNERSQEATMYDYERTNKPQPMSPEALKVRRAPAVLQAPTIV